MVVYKYILEGDESEIRMPERAELLHVALQGSRLCLWARVAKDAKEVTRTVRVVGTGWDNRADGVYVGTVLTASGALVWHVFDLGES